jgi:3-methyladenine DNA glycosylase Mpg
MPPAPGYQGRNAKVAAALFSTAGVIYLYTMHHLKTSAPGVLDQMVRA